MCKRQTGVPTIQSFEKQLYQVSKDPVDLKVLYSLTK